jgi:hypothetical protein
MARENDRGEARQRTEPPPPLTEMPCLEVTKARIVLAEMHVEMRSDLKAVVELEGRVYR